MYHYNQDCIQMILNLKKNALFVSLGCKGKAM